MHRHRGLQSLGRALLRGVVAACVLLAPTEAAGADLKALDALVRGRQQAIEARQRKIDSLQARLVADPADRYVQLRQLYSLYREFDVDSALSIAAQRQAAARLSGDRRRLSTATLNLVASEIKAGSLHMALARLDSINALTIPDEPDFQRRYLHSLYSQAWEGLARRDGVPSHRAAYLALARAHRDSALRYASTDQRLNLNLHCQQALERGDILTAQHYVDTMLLYSAGERRAAEYILGARTARRAGDEARAIDLLAEGATLDLESGKRDCEALMLLAQALHRAGDTDRAYEYIYAALEDARAAHATERAEEILEAVPLIGAAYQEKASDAARALTFTIVLVGVVLGLVAVGWWLTRERLRTVRDLSRRLEEANEELRRAGEVKEAYISELFAAHSSFIERMGRFRKTVMRLGKASQWQQLADAVDSRQIEAEELKELYERFDRMFLALHPDFVSDYNARAAEGCQAAPREGSLTPELRVLAVMQLGITETQAIAALLHYSPRTVYNYRHTLRRALGE